MNRRTASSTLMALLGSALCLQGEDGRSEHPGESNDPEEKGSAGQDAKIAVSAADTPDQSYNLTPLSQLEDGCVYAHLSGGFGGEFSEVIRFTKWERVLVTTLIGRQGPDETLSRSRGLKGGTLINDAGIAEIIAATNKAVDAPLQPYRYEESGDDFVMVIAARKDKGNITCRARVFFTNEFLEPEMRTLVTLLSNLSAVGVPGGKKPATSRKPEETKQNQTPSDLPPP